MDTIGILHPGAMGTSLGAALSVNGHEVLWAGEERSAATRARADADGLTDVGALAALVRSADTIVSVCPPGAAAEVAGAVADLGYDGIYLDANAVAPDTARTMAATVEAGGASFVDGGIIGPPARSRGLTVLYLSGDSTRVAAIEALFHDSPVMTHAVAGPPGAASATKMAFAGWTKGTSALLLAIRALAEKEGVTDSLEHAWSVLTPDLPERLTRTAAGSGPKAWRFEGEMREIAATFDTVGLPGGFHEAAAEIYGRLADLRDGTDVTINDVTERL